MAWVNHPKTYQPSDLGGPLSSIRPATPESRKRQSENVQLAGVEWIEPHAQMCRVELNPDMLAGHIVFLAIQYAVELLRTKHDRVVEIEPSAIVRAIHRVAPGLSKSIMEADESGGPLYDQLGAALLEALYGEMRFAIRRNAATLTAGQQIVFGDYESVLRDYLRLYSMGQFMELFYRATESLLNRWVHPILRKTRHDIQGPRGLEFIIGLEDDPDWFLASLTTVATVEDDWRELEKITTDPSRCGLASHYTHDPKMPPRRISGEDLQMRYAVAQASMHDGFWQAERPFAYLAEAARDIMRRRQRLDEADHIRARKADTGIDALDAGLDERGFGYVPPFDSAGESNELKEIFSIFVSDHNKALALSGGDEFFFRAWTDRVLRNKPWSAIARSEGIQLDDLKHFPEFFRRQYSEALRRYIAIMRPYISPERKTTEEILAAGRNNSVTKRNDLGTYGSGAEPGETIMREGRWHWILQQ